MLFFDLEKVMQKVFLTAVKHVLSLSIYEGIKNFAGSSWMAGSFSEIRLHQLRLFP